MEWSKLQNGSDIRGVAMEGIKGENVNLTPEIVEILGKSFVYWLEKQGFPDKRLKVAVGTDSRITGPELSEAFIRGIVSMGAEAYDCGMASTPAMFMTTLSEDLMASAGVMLTASHLPFNRNGLKFFTEKGGLDKKNIREILEIAENKDFPERTVTAKVHSINFIDEYSSFLIDYIRQGANNKEDVNRPLKGLKIIVDAGNGAGGFFAGKVLYELGADITGSQFLEPDGNFPNHVPNPENDEAMNSICNAVLEEKADLGIIFDTDVDRAALVDHNGEPVNRNQLIALISAVILSENPGSIIVTDSITSEGLTQFIESDLEGVHHRFKRGYKNVIDEAIRLNSEGKECHLAIETSGHAALKENHFLDDGAYLVAKLLVKMAKMKVNNKNLTDLIGNLKKPVESREYRFKILKENFSEYGNEIISQLTEKVSDVDGWEIAEPNYEGLRVKCTNKDEQGWFLIRISLHDPVMPLNVESDIEGGVNSITSSLYELLNSFSGLDYSSISE